MKRLILWASIVLVLLAAQLMAIQYNRSDSHNPGASATGLWIPADKHGTFRPLAMDINVSGSGATTLALVVYHRPATGPLGATDSTVIPVVNSSGYTAIWHYTGPTSDSMRVTSGINFTGGIVGYQ